jgi:hypothetical protein
MTIPWDGAVNGLWFNLWPFFLLVLVKESLNPLLKNSLTRDASINVDCVFQFTICHVISRTTWWIILYWTTNICMYWIFWLVIVPRGFCHGVKGLLLICDFISFLCGIFIWDLGGVLNFFLATIYPPIFFMILFIG